MTHPATNPTASIPAQAARRLFLHAQGMLDDPTRHATPASVYALIERMGFVQIDSIRVVERAHHLTLAARLDGYRPAMLTRLLERDRRLFEHWTHDAAAIPTAWFAHWRPRFAQYRGVIENHKWWRERLGPDKERIATQVLERIRTEGPLQAKDFEPEVPRGPSGGWWGWTPEKAALEFLWYTGELAIARRVQFQKVYDLTERVLPQALRAAPPDARRLEDWMCGEALLRLGVATAREIAAYWGTVSLLEAKGWCEAAARQGTIVPVVVETADGSRPRLVWTRADWQKRVARAPDAPERLRVLSPFDPVVRDRARTRRLFGFDYAFEAFTPAAKRQYGYYVLPLFEAERFVGRADAAREAERLLVRRVWWEPGVRPTAARRRQLRLAFERLGACLELDTVISARVER